jgi:DNA polymerase-3 subunit beta
MADEKLQMIKLSIQKNTVEINSENQNIGDAQESVPIQYESDNLDIFFNSHYLINVINEISAEDIIIEFNTPLTPVKIRPQNDDYYLFVVMPMRKAYS